MVDALCIMLGAFVGTMLGNMVWYSILKSFIRKHEYDEPNGQ